MLSTEDRCHVRKAIERPDLAVVLSTKDRKHALIAVERPAVAVVLSTEVAIY